MVADVIEVQQPIAAEAHKQQRRMTADGAVPDLAEPARGFVYGQAQAEPSVPHRGGSNFASISAKDCVVPAGLIDDALQHWPFHGQQTENRAVQAF